MCHYRHRDCYSLGFQDSLGCDKPLLASLHRTHKCDSQNHSLHVHYIPHLLLCFLDNQVFHSRFHSSLTVGCSNIPSYCHMCHEMNIVCYILDHGNKWYYNGKCGLFDLLCHIHIGPHRLGPSSLCHTGNRWEGHV